MPRATNPSASRRPRARRGEGERLREEILEVTERLISDTTDADAVSIRTIAAAVGVAPAAIYLHFPDRDALMREVCTRTFEGLREATARAAAETTDPVERLQRMGLAYVRFGLEHPEQYRIIFMGREEEGADLEPSEAARRLSSFEVLVEAVTECVREGIVEGDPWLLACGLWLAVHGLTSALIALPGFPWGDTEALTRHVVETHMRGLQQSSPR